MYFYIKKEVHVLYLHFPFIILLSLKDCIRIVLFEPFLAFLIQLVRYTLLTLALLSLLVLFVHSRIVSLRS